MAREHKARDAEEYNFLYAGSDGKVFAKAYTTITATTVENGVTRTITETIALEDYKTPVAKAASVSTAKKSAVKTTAKTTAKKTTTKSPATPVKNPASAAKTTPKTTSKTPVKTTTKALPTTAKTTASSAKPPVTTSKSSTTSAKPASTAAASTSSLPTVRMTSTRTSTITVQPTTATTTSRSLASLQPSVTQTASSTVVATSGTIHSSLETSGNPSSQPFVTSVASASSTISLINTASTTLPSTSMAPSVPTIEAQNLFAPIGTAAPPASISQRPDHPVARLGIQSQTAKLSTNKFYANFFLNNQNQPTWTHPYSIAWAKGAGVAKSWGVYISHTERGMITYGDANPYGDGNPARYFINPVGIQSLILSAQELGSSTVLTMDSLTAFSANVNLAARSGSSPLLTLPLVQGMGFITARYNGASPLIQSSVSVLSMVYSGKVNGTGIHKYKAGLGDQTTWLIYVTPDDATYAGNTFTLQNGNNITAAAGFKGTIQIAKLPSSQSTAEATYDASAGAYHTSATIDASASGTSGTYTLTFAKGGLTGRPLLTFALPHHVQTLANGQKTAITLTTTTKGLATAIIGDSWTLVEASMPVDIGFAPWTTDLGSVSSVSTTAQTLIKNAAKSELGQDMAAQSNLNSMYFSGKALAKFAQICIAANDLGGNKTIAYSGLQKLQAAFATFVNNKQQYPLVYESAWGGLVSSATYVTGDAGQDFGNTYYNDHHFHYAYFVYAASVIGYLDPTWLTDANKDWVNALIRDFGNPSTSDPFFPFSRGFDWYHGHSWAKGLFESGDGKDQESSSEDSMAAYSVKMWGHVINDKSMEGRGALMMAIQARAAQNYYLYTSDNTVQPARFIGNKVAGILFENKIDHTTYFGANIEYIQGIHMIPLMPFSPYVRTKKFVTEEWNTYFANGVAEKVAGGWRGILFANYALINPSAAWSFFSNPNFDAQYLDGGASLTWYLALTAALGGSRA